eukprot:gnl/Spiro4/10653_TR5698_c0_g1_i1.p1 gnl/Spiro4/10653_TR5698_c0_g1~~gnl/Spiro4/10653_TR5698_c0_g1_i1.p1  ORF type:complete len:863 (+),score=293.34 gnl/Spiro4/10653_TR5698_c0_g1_i1:38-2626(+)
MLGQTLLTKSESNSLSTRYVRFLLRARFFIIGFWVIFFGLSLYFGPQLLSNLSNAFDPPSGTRANEANKDFAAAFPSQASQSFLLVFIESLKHQSILTSATANFDFALYAKAQSYRAGLIGTYASYYTLQSANLPPQAYVGMVSADNSSTYIQIVLNCGMTDTVGMDLATELDDFIHSNWTDSSVEVTLSGVPAFTVSIEADAKHDMELVDGIAMPIALIVLMFILRSWRLLVLPLLSIFIGALGSFMIIDWAAISGYDVFSTTPNLMMTLCVAMSIDYSLFLLARYREELRQDTPDDSAVSQMLRYAGHTVIVSGATLSLCFLGLLFIPLNLVSSLGLGCAISVSVTLLINITLVPALLLTFRGFFSASREAMWGLGWLEPAVRTPRARAVSVAATEQLRDPSIQYKELLETTAPPTDRRVSDAPVPCLGEVRDDILLPHKSGMWYTLGRVLMKWPWNLLLVIIIVAVVIPFSFYVFSATLSDSMLINLPRGAPSTVAWGRLGEVFGYGPVFPFQLLVRTTDPATFPVVSNQFALRIKAIIDNLSNLTDTPLSVFQALMFNSQANTTIPAAVFQQCAQVPWCPTPDCQSCNGLNSARKMFVNPKNDSTFVVLQRRPDPLQPAGRVWIEQALKQIDALQARPDFAAFRLSLRGPGPDAWDAIGQAYHDLPIMVTITLATVLLLMTLTFRSLLIPLRAVITIGLTLLWVYGLTDMVYEHGIFDWMHFGGLHSMGALSWLPPICSFSIIVGIGLDYDIFLLVRILEYYDKGMSTKEAIVSGLAKTGNIITAAGIIMAIAFSGLLFSQIGLANVLAFYMVFAVLFDTFVVRSILVPAMMSLLGGANWWPRFGFSVCSGRKPTLSL